MTNSREVLKKDLEKIAFIFRLLDANYYSKDEDLSDHAKRCFLRFFFILIDDLLKIIGKVKNTLSKSHDIDRNQKRDLEAAISRLKKTFDGEYDHIRDKLSAHQQKLDLAECLLWWTEIDQTTIEIIYGEADEIRSILKLAGKDIFRPIADYEKMKIPGDLPISKDCTQFQVSTDRLAAAKENTIFSIPCHSSQEKAQIVVSLIDFLEIDFALIHLLDNRDTAYKGALFDMAWLLVIIDCCSLIDNLYLDKTDDPSLLSSWRDVDMRGLLLLEQGFQSRNLALEEEIRLARNRLAAHIDTMTDIGTLCRQFETLDRLGIREYVSGQISALRTACGLDPRTKMFRILNARQDGIVGLCTTFAKPFED